MPFLEAIGHGSDSVDISLADVWLLYAFQLSFLEEEVLYCLTLRDLNGLSTCLVQRFNINLVVKEYLETFQIFLEAGQVQGSSVNSNLVNINFFLLEEQAKDLRRGVDDGQL